MYNKIMPIKLGKLNGGGFMNKEEILQASRNENQNRDIYELEVISKGQRIGGLIGVSIAFILMLVEGILFENDMNYGYFLIIISSGAGLWIYKSLKLKRKHEIFLAAFWSVLAIYFAVMTTLKYIG